MNIYLVRWRIDNVYGDPEGAQLVQAKDSEQAVQKVETAVRATMRFGEFVAVPENVTQFQWLIEFYQKQSPDTRRLTQGILKALG